MNGDETNNYIYACSLLGIYSNNAGRTYIGERGASFPCWNVISGEGGLGESSNS